MEATQNDPFEPADQLPLEEQAPPTPQCISLEDPDPVLSPHALKLLAGNPILPPGRHHLREQPQLKLKFTNLREKFNRTSCGGSAEGKSFLRAKQESYSLKGQQSAKTGDGEEDEEYLRLLQRGREIYRRLKNSKLNQLGKESVLCSLFFDWRKERIATKGQPLWECIGREQQTAVRAPGDDWLQFGSGWEGGNLLSVLRSGEGGLATYELYLQNDINTKGCTQWYYFSVTSRSRGKAKLRLMNFYKPTSLYQKGMKVLCSRDQLDWKRTGTAISYAPSLFERGRYALEFIHDFEHPNVTIYFAYGYPYTYTTLNRQLATLANDPRTKNILRSSTLCLSAMGNPIPLLSISNFATKTGNRPIVYIIGRQHPGETPASYVVQGLLTFLLSVTVQARELRERYQFRVVPMVNVDGVISGNYRCNLSGCDVNRQWQFPSKRGQPEIFWLKQEIAANKKQTVFFLDIHAHSRKMNSFFYGSKAADRDSRLFPFLCSKLNKYISYPDSSFADDPSKKTTARVVLQTELMIPHSLTFEVSFYGWVDPQKEVNYTFRQTDLKLIGQSLGMGFYYCLIGMERARKPDDPKALPKCATEKEKLVLRNCNKMLEKWTRECEKEGREDDDNFSEGSSLDPEHFQLKEEERQFVAEMSRNEPMRREGSNDAGKRNMSTPKEQRPHSRKKRLLIYSTLSPGDDPQSKLLAPKGPDSSLGISGDEFYHFSNSAKGPKKQPFSVRELQLQLQLGGQRGPEKKLRGVRLKMGNANLSGFDRYESLEVERADHSKNYKQEVLEMKKALKYLLETKSSDYEQYRSCFKSFNSEHGASFEKDRFNDKKFQRRE